MPDEMEPAGPMPVAAVETHLSQVFLTADRAYKLLKPVETPFVSYRDRDQRILAASREFDLNYRMAPDVYLGTADVDEGGDVVDRMIVMRRLPDDRRLDVIATRAETGPGPEGLDCVRDTAKHLAAVHAAEPPITDERAQVASAETIETRWQENFDALEAHVGSLIDRQEYDEVHDLATRYVKGRRRLFDHRIEIGLVRDGHGDLRAEHVFCEDDGPRFIDCLAFRDDFRIGDVLNDAAFLAMDLHRLAGPEPARSLIRHYCEFTNEHHPATLAHHYVAYRAHVRAKVAAIRFGQGDQSAAADVAAYHHLAWQHLDVGRVRLVQVGGEIGVGKSTVSEGLAARLGATWLRTDEIRKTASERTSGVTYDQETRHQVYLDLIDQAEHLLVNGESVVLDATWASEEHRELARALAERTGADLTALRIRAPLEVACARIQIRTAVNHDPSDATPELARQFAGRYPDWPGAADVDACGTVAEAVEEACRAVIGSGDEEGGPAEEAGSVAAGARPVGADEPDSDHTEAPVRVDRRAVDALENVSPDELNAVMAQMRRSVIPVAGVDTVDFTAVRFYLRRATSLVPAPEPEADGDDESSDGE